jgi:hypothetical protein
MLTAPPLRACALSFAITATTLALVACSGDAPGTPPSSPSVVPSVSPSLSPSVAPSTSASTQGSPSFSPTGPSSPEALTIRVGVDRRKVTPPPADIPLRAGTAVKLVITSTTANEVHVHGIDLERALPAGTPVTLDLRLPEPGIYEVESHEPELRLLRFIVR